MANKITVVEKFGMVKAFLEENGASKDMVTFIQERADLQAKKSGGAKKPTANQVANEGIKAEIVSIVENGDGMTATEIMEALDGDYTIQKITSLLTALAKARTIERVKDKKTTLFYGKTEKEEFEED